MIIDNLRQRPVQRRQPVVAKSRRAPLRAGRVSTHVVLIIGLVLFAFPFYWLVVMATTSTSDMYSFPPRLWPGTDFFSNFAKAVNGSGFWLAFFNSTWLTITTSVIQLFLAALAGYTFAKRRFPGNGKLFGILLITLVLPTGVSIVPLFQIYAQLGWLNTFLPLIIPNAVTAFAVFWMRQASIASIPQEVIDAASIDGAGFFRTFWSIGLPAMRPSLVALGIFQVMWTWNDYLWPLLVLGQPSQFTLPIAIQQLKGNYGSIDYSVVMAGTLVATLPLVLLFVFLRKTILENVAGGAVKG
ncbi:carbohydrate ABC transporter permease (plasmid) [Curtobacterium sp. MCLR17_007]|uniref:carbohydrate ABC transporter permease n=1 Tax=Curtobacterium sp. MCLR17_007 TaxID=2175648 RepID=UPI0021AD223F|nr:carbohydrate ABC transporter permease [Curtobacterium sp. MCLR17_007]WIB62109.1 carbohydrate ABC transporter permease [Curtobacterium sp. MCLR17_007]